jgi:inner membrane transporter RhtA
VEQDDRRLGRGVGTALVGMGSVHTGAAVASSLMERVGPAGAVLLRQGLAALVLLAVTRPRIRTFDRSRWLTVVAFGTVLAGMNLTFYGSVERIPLGLAVTIELLGPLGLAASLSRRAGDFGWVALAVGGVLLLGRPGGGLDGLGVLLALLAALGWAGYIALQRRAGTQSAGTDVLACSLTVAAVIVAPVAIADGGGSLASPRSLALGAVVAVLGALVPFSADLRALRDVPARVFGVLMSLSPAVASLVGFLILDERLRGRELAGVAAVVVASAGTLWSSRPRTPAPPALDPLPV